MSLQPRLHGPENLTRCFADGRLFKGFEEKVENLYDSPTLRNVTKLADNLIDKIREETVDVAKALLIGIPTQPANHLCGPAKVG